MPVKVFLADDHAVIRDGLRVLLEAESDIAVVGTADNGHDAVLQIQELGPDIAIMDIAMPELNGIDATNRISEVCPSTKVIILSMHQSREHIYQAFKAGASGYVIKKSAGSEVAEAVRTVYNGNSFLSRGIHGTVIDDYIRRSKVTSSISPIEKLGPREREVLQLVVEGKSSRAISEVLFISPKTVETYRHRLMKKLDVRDLPSLVKFAVQHGLTPLD